MTLLPSRTDSVGQRATWKRIPGGRRSSPAILPVVAPNCLGQQERPAPHEWDRPVYSRFSPRPRPLPAPTRWGSYGLSTHGCRPARHCCGLAGQALLAVVIPVAMLLRPPWSVGVTATISLPVALARLARALHIGRRFPDTGACPPQLFRANALLVSLETTQHLRCAVYLGLVDYPIAVGVQRSEQSLLNAGTGLRPNRSIERRSSRPP